MGKRYRIHCPQCDRTIAESRIAVRECPWTCVNAVECTPLVGPPSNQLDPYNELIVLRQEQHELANRFVWQSLFLGLGGDPAMLQ